jgi:hypothetical protein
MTAPMSNSNIKGEFERALQRWHVGAMYLCRRMGRAANSAHHAAGLLEKYASRELFYRDGQLVAFPALDLLALLAGVNEKTIRRGIEKLEQAGLVRIQHRYNDNNRYTLTIPVAAEDHLSKTDAAIERRRKTIQRLRDKTVPTDRKDKDDTAPKCPTTVPAPEIDQPHSNSSAGLCPSVHHDRTDGSNTVPKCPTTSDLTSDLPLSLRGAFSAVGENNLEGKKEEERQERESGEEGKQERTGEPQAPSDNPSLPSGVAGISEVHSAAPEVPKWRDLFDRAERLKGNRRPGYGKNLVHRCFMRKVAPQDVLNAIIECENSGEALDGFALERLRRTQGANQ